MTGQNGKESDAAWMELREDVPSPGTRAFQGHDLGEILYAWVFAMVSTKTSHSGNGYRISAGYAIAVASGPVFRSLFPSTQVGKVPNFRGSRQRMAWEGGVV